MAVVSWREGAWAPGNDSSYRMFPRASCALERKGLLRWMCFPFMPLFWWLELKCGSWGFPERYSFLEVADFLFPGKMLVHVNIACRINLLCLHGWVLQLPVRCSCVENFDCEVFFLVEWTKMKPEWVCQAGTSS